MTHEKLVTGTTSPTRYTKIIRNPGAGTKYNRTYQETDYVSRYTKTVAGGKDYTPPAPPEPEFNPPIVATKAQMSELNVYEIGETIEAFAATWREGNPDNQIYRSRWQYRVTESEPWVNESWTTHVNQQVKFEKELDAAGIYRFNTQVRDETFDPVAQVNSFGQSKTVDFPEPMVVVPPTLSGTPRVGSTITCSEPVVTGGIAPYSFSYMWLDSETKSPANDTVLLEFDEGKMVSCYVTVTDAIGTIEHTESNKVGPIEPAPTIGNISLTVDDVPVVWGEAVHVPVNTPVHVVATISGNANPTYKWEARGEYPLMVGSQAATTTLTFPEEGGPTVTLTVTDSTASDSPIAYAMNFYVASQTEWDLLHPTTTN